MNENKNPSSRQGVATPLGVSRLRPLAFALALTALLAIGPRAEAVDGLGLYDTITGTFQLIDSNGTPLPRFRYGPPMAFGRLPIAGNWDGARGAGGRGDTIGLYNPRNGLFLLRNSNTSGFADFVIRFGGKGRFGWTPLAGDWTGRGRDSVGVYDPRESVFYLRRGLGRRPGRIVFQFGDLGFNYTPVVGDWNQDGIDEVGLYDSINGVFLLRNSNRVGPASVRQRLNLARTPVTLVRFGEQGLGWQPVAGNWTVSFFDSIGLYDPFENAFLLRFTNTSGLADRVVRFGRLGGGRTQIPLAGNWRR